MNNKTKLTILTCIYLNDAINLLIFIIVTVTRCGDWFFLENCLTSVGNLSDGILSTSPMNSGGDSGEEGELFYKLYVENRKAEYLRCEKAGEAESKRGEEKIKTYNHWLEKYNTYINRWIEADMRGSKKLLEKCSLEEKIEIGKQYTKHLDSRKSLTKEYFDYFRKFNTEAGDFVKRGKQWEEYKKNHDDGVESLD